MNADLAITIIEAVLAPKSLNIVQQEIIRGAIEGRSYQAIIAAMDLGLVAGAVAAAGAAAQASVGLDDGPDTQVEGGGVSRRGWFDYPFIRINGYNRL